MTTATFDVPFELALDGLAFDALVFDGLVFDALVFDGLAFDALALFGLLRELEDRLLDAAAVCLRLVVERVLAWAMAPP